MSSQGVQGHDMFARQIAKEFTNEIAMWMPDWKVSGDYNFHARGASQAISLQLDTLLHSGPHDWLNQGLRDVLLEIRNIADDDPRFAGVDSPKTAAFGALLNFLEEGNNPDGVKTNGFVSWSSLRDPQLLAREGRQLTSAQMIDSKRRVGFIPRFFRTQEGLHDPGFVCGPP